MQIMDAKMDSGYFGPGENHAQALEDDYDVMRELAPEEVMGIMDELLCHEVGTGLYFTMDVAKYTASADGMAHGTSPFSNALHIHIYRQTVMAYTK